MSDVNDLKFRKITAMCDMDGVAVVGVRNLELVTWLQDYCKSQNRDNIGTSQGTGNGSLEKGDLYIAHT